MHKLKAFLGSVLDVKNSETYMLWGGILAKVGCLIPAVCAAEQTLSGVVGMTPDVMIGSALVYALGRMTSKAAKAQPAK